MVAWKLGITASVAVRAGVAPQQLVESTIGREWDVEAGYVFEGGSDAERHGGFLTGRWWPARGMRAPSASRFGFEGGASVFDSGPGAHVGLTFEVARFVEGPHASLDRDDDSDGDETIFLGVHFGELAIGVGIDGAWRHVDGRDEWLALGLLTVRLPAAFGVAFVPIWQASSSETGQ